MPGDVPSHREFKNRSIALATSSVCAIGLQGFSASRIAFNNLSDGGLIPFLTIEIYGFDNLLNWANSVTVYLLSSLDTFTGIRIPLGAPNFVIKTLTE